MLVAARVLSRMDDSWTTSGFYGTIGTFIADVTGDGKADAVSVSADKITVRRSDGSRFITPAVNWTSVPFYGDGCTSGP